MQAASESMSAYTSWSASEKMKRWQWSDYWVVLSITQRFNNTSTLSSENDSFCLIEQRNTGRQAGH